MIMHVKITYLTYPVIILRNTITHKWVKPVKCDLLK